MIDESLNELNATESKIDGEILRHQAISYANSIMLAAAQSFVID